jgi:hypothetical protein
MSATAADTFDRSLELMYTALLCQRSARALRRRGRPEIRGGSERGIHVAQVMMLPEKRIRDAAQILVGLRDFHVRRRVCYRCERTDDMIVMPIE